MAEEFELLKTIELAPEAIHKTVANLQGLPSNLELDPDYGQGMSVGNRRWAFVLTKEAVNQWERLGQEPLTLAVLAHYLPEPDRDYAQRMLVALPGTKKGQIRMEMRDITGYVLWTGTGTLKAGDLHFSMPVTREGVKSGIVEGRLSAKGKVTLSEARLPRPLKKKSPTLVAEE